MKPRWDPCVVQNSREFDEFLVRHLDNAKRRILVVGGAGFDPRATLGARRLSNNCKKCTFEAVFFREERIMDQPLLRPRADQAEKDIKVLFPQSTFPRIKIIPDGVTAVGGRQAVVEVGKNDLSRYTDIVIDISALSSSVYFPLVAFFVAACNSLPSLNLHLLVVEQPKFDEKINGIPSDHAALLHGYKGGQSLDSNEESALLWIPTLSIGNIPSMNKIYQFIRRKDTPIDVCPIMPFPGQGPRLPDRLHEEYSEELRTWNVDARNFLYAAESDPMDSYRAIHQLVSERRRLFERLGGSQVVLSPLGNKMLAVGAMLAAIDLILPVAMVEAIGYDETKDLVTARSDVNFENDSNLRHIWLCGEAYPRMARK